MVERLRHRRSAATVVAASIGRRMATFRLRAARVLTLTYEGIAGDRHSGLYATAARASPGIRAARRCATSGSSQFSPPKNRRGGRRRSASRTLTPEWIGGNLALSGRPGSEPAAAADAADVPGGAHNPHRWRQWPVPLVGRSIAAHFPGRSRSRVRLRQSRAKQARPPGLGGAGRRGKVGDTGQHPHLGTGALPRAFR